MELVKREETALISKEDFETLIKFDEMEKRVKVIREKIRASGNELLTEMNTDSYRQSQDGATILIYNQKPYKKKVVDTKALKEQGLYDLYTHDVWVKGTTRIQIEYDD